MQKFISFKNLYEFNTITNAPVFLYMMDMAPMTGGCHYAWNCLKYIEECGKCPAIFSNIINDQTHINYKFKLKYIQKTNITVIAASEQQALQLESSSLYFSKRKAKILIGVDSFVFNPFSKSDERINFGLPTNKKILFFGAVSVDAKRKGFIQLIEALNHLKEQNPDIGNEIHLAIAGHAGSELIGSLPFNYTSLGSLNHSQLARAFQFSDIFISPSIEDSGPMMINQSIMSGTPVVAFDIGVALDLVKTSETGYLASYGDSIDLSNGIKRILDLEEIDYIRMCKKCRNLGLEKCNPRLQASEFHKIMIS